MLQFSDRTKDEGGHIRQYLLNNLFLLNLSNSLNECKYCNCHSLKILIEIRFMFTTLLLLNFKNPTPSGDSLCIMIILLTFLQHSMSTTDIYEICQISRRG